MEAKEVGAYEAKTRFSRLLEEVRRGRTFTITRRGKRIAELRPVPAKKGPQYGRYKGRIRIADDFRETPPEFDEYMR